MIRFDIITLFPRMFDSPLQESLLKKAQERGLIEIAVHDLRTWAEDRHRTADDTAYGGGAGMVMKVEPIVKALESIAQSQGNIPHSAADPAGQAVFAGCGRRACRV